MSIHHAIDQAVTQLDIKLAQLVDTDFVNEDLVDKFISAKINIDSGKCSWDDLKLVLQLMRNVVLPLQIQQQVNRLQSIKEYEL